MGGAETPVDALLGEVSFIWQFGIAEFW